MLRFQEQLNLLRATDLSQTHVFKQFKKFSESWLSNSTITNQHPIQTFTREVNIFIDYDLLPAFKRLENFIMLEYRQVQCEQKRRSKSQLQLSKLIFSVNARRSLHLLGINVCKPNRIVLTKPGETIFPKKSSNPKFLTDTA